MESLLAGQRAALLIEDPHDGSVLAMVSSSSSSYDPNPFVKGISYQAYKKLLQDKDLALINNGRVIAPHLLEKTQRGTLVENYHPQQREA